MCEINVKELREQNKMTRAALAKIMGVSTQTVKNWESGKKIPSTALMKLQDVFHLNVGNGDTIASNVNGNNVQNGGIVIEALIAQLNVKDKQIEKLMSIIEKFKKP